MQAKYIEIRDALREHPDGVWQWITWWKPGAWGFSFWHWIPPWSVIGPHHRTGEPFPMEYPGPRDAYFRGCDVWYT